MDTLIHEPALLTGLVAITLVVGAGIVSDLRRRATPNDPDRSPLGAYGRTAASLWGLALTCLVCWILSGRPAATLGLALPTGWGGALAWIMVAASAVYAIYCVVMATLDRDTRIKLRRDFATAEGFAMIRPRTKTEHLGFQGLSVTAGITEEIIFRGFLIATLALVLPIWVSAMVAVAGFLVAHAYQGWAGMIRILPVTLVMTMVVLIGGSLWPAMIIHVLVDALAGLLVAITDAHAEADAHMEKEEAAPAPAAV